MKKLMLVMLAGVLVASIAFGDWTTDQPYKMHWPQLPDLFGWDVNATNPVILADDWMCSETGWVKDVHFWGSWRGGIEGQIISFNISFHEDIPADPPLIPYSRPGATIWEGEVTEFIIATPEWQPGLQGWYDPQSGMFVPNDHEEFFQYNIFLPEEDWLWQEEGTIYWLNISATLADPINTHWGVKSSQDHWNDDAVWGEWGVLDWIEMYEPPGFMESLDLAFVITGEPSDEEDTCEYYKPRYLDYAPQGMPDFDQKQIDWSDAFGWTHCGPAAVANCLWWFDSKFEPSPVDPRPFGGASGVSDNYPLVVDMTGQGLDDHDTANVQPLINNLAALMNTNTAFRGTPLIDLVNGTQAYITLAGLTDYYQDSLQPAPTFDFIKQEVLDCQDVILQLGFLEYFPGTDEYCMFGAHYVTIAGVCTTQARICISDPFYDMLEGEPPSGSAHGGEVHNDADNISGPHGQIHHDPYRVTVFNPGLPWPGPYAQLHNYPMNLADAPIFQGANTDVDVCLYQGGAITTVIMNAYVICPDTPVVIDSCEYYKAPYDDYAPYGMPDFDQKQDAWVYGPTGAWSHCGPVALANCFWWFDSKFEYSPLDPKPFYPDPSHVLNDNYGLVYSFDPSGRWDDHDTNNVMPFVDSLAQYCLTNTTGSGTFIGDLANGAQAWLTNVGLGDKYLINTYLVDDIEANFEFLRHEVLRSQDVILLLGFWLESQPDICERIGGHYVTVAGTCVNPEDSSFCISDPYLDMHEGEPPAGSAHGSSVHNDAQYISGPHGTMYHDKYMVIPTTCTPVLGPPFVIELSNYPAGTVAPAFIGQNPFDPSIAPVGPGPGIIHTVVEYALVICPDRDGDGWSDDMDNCPDVPNPSQTNSDSDSHGDACDNCPNTPNEDQADVDGDGHGDVCDNCPVHANGDQANSDADSHGDVCDNCPTTDNESQTNSDADSHGDVCDNCPTTDNESQTNSDADSHGDACDNCPNDDNETQSNADTDSHGDACDNCPEDDNEDQSDLDADFHGDVCDNCPTDINPSQHNSDADSHGDACDNCPTTNNESQSNMDPDSHGDACDNCPSVDNESQTNSDGDSHGDDCDNCPTTDNESQTNSDADSHGDACDNCPTADNESQTNSDGDSHGDDCDNCPTTDNESQTNSDSDSHGDVCDNCPNDDNEDQADSDGDGIGDVCDTGECDCDPGNADTNTPINLLDILYIISYVYDTPPGPAPVPYDTCSGDPTCDCVVNLLDILHLISYVYDGNYGDPPNCTCEDWVAACGLPLRKK